MDLVKRAKREALDNTDSLLILNIKSCNAVSSEGNETGAPNDGFLKNIENTFLAIHKVLLALWKCIPSGAIKFVSVRPF